MSKNQTQWSNSTKNTDVWTGASKNTSVWASNNTKNVSVFTVASRNTDSWSNESIVQTAYLYDASTITYNNTFSYDYLVPVANQSNNKQPTAWVI